MGRYRRGVTRIVPNTEPRASDYFSLFFYTEHGTKAGAKESPFRRLVDKAVVSFTSGGRLLIFQVNS